MAGERFNRAMISLGPLVDGGLIDDYDWTKHGESATIVDVGSGTGAAAIELTKRFPKLQIIMQDKPEVIESAKKVWLLYGLKDVSKLNRGYIIVLGNHRIRVLASGNDGPARLLLSPTPPHLAASLSSKNLFPSLYLT